jgi:hypothetical protein
MGIQPGSFLQTVFDIRDRKWMSDCVQSLHKSEQWEVYRILHAGGLNHTRNKYGLFFDVTNAPNDVLQIVKTFLDFIHESKQYLESTETAPTQLLSSLGDILPDISRPVIPCAIQQSLGSPPLGGEDERQKRDAGVVRQSDSVKLFIQSMIKLKEDSPGVKKREASRFQAYRKKYSRQVNQKGTQSTAGEFLSEEAFTDDE